jgi:hypothetical protein
MNYFFPIYFYFSVTKSLVNLRKLYVDKYLICIHTFNKINILLPTYIGILKIMRAPPYVNLMSRHRLKFEIRILF